MPRALQSGPKEQIQTLLRVSVMASLGCKGAWPQAEKSKPAGLVPATSLPGTPEEGQLLVLPQWAFRATRQVGDSLPVAI